METLRFADRTTAARYPLPVRGPARWVASDAGTLWTLHLPTISAGSILTPSFSQLPDTDQHYRWQLRCSGRTWTLQTVPSVRQQKPPQGVNPGATHDTAENKSSDTAAVTTHIDCFHVHESLNDAALTLQLTVAAPFDRYLLSVSTRRLELDTVAAPPGFAGLPEAPPALTQMTADSAVAGRICSPTCVAMVMAHRQRARAGNPMDTADVSTSGTLDSAPAPATPPRAEGWNHLRDEMVDACLDPATGMYGVWPLALRAAALRGSLGAVEMFADWHAPLQVLAAGIPLITSIRFARGELAGAPLEQTGGHLVVLYAAGPDQVWVNDPAAADSAGVTRRYAAGEFSRAWLRHRGAAYILLP
jgi:hypothetical protein